MPSFADYHSDCMRTIHTMDKPSYVSPDIASSMSTEHINAQELHYTSPLNTSKPKQHMGSNVGFNMVSSPLVTLLQDMLQKTSCNSNAVLLGSACQCAKCGVISQISTEPSPNGSLIVWRCAKCADIDCSENTVGMQSTTLPQQLEPDLSLDTLPTFRERVSQSSGSHGSPPSSIMEILPGSYGNNNTIK